MPSPILAFRFACSVTVPVIAALLHGAMAQPLASGTETAIQVIVSEALSAADASSDAPRLAPERSPEVSPGFLALEKSISRAYDLYHRQALSLALALFRRTLQRAIAAQDTLHIGICFNGMGLIYIRCQHYEPAEKYCRAAAHILADTEAVTHRAEALHNWGLVQYHQHQDAAALSCWQQALTLWQRAEDSLGEAQTLAYLGRLHIRHQEYGFALASFEAAIDLFQEVADEVDVGAEVAALVEHIGLVCEQTHHDDLAILHYQDAHDLYRLLAAPLDASRVLHRLGQLHERLGTLAISLHYYHQALKTAESLSQIRPHP